MKTSVLSGVFSVMITLSAVLSASAQCTEWNWPEDKAKAEESVVLLKDNKTSGQFKQAIPPLNWILTNAPNLNTSVYIYGIEVYDGLAEKEKDAAQKAKYADSLLILHDMRIKNCGDEASVTNRKAIFAYKYFINSDRVKEVLQIMDKAFEMNGENVMDGTLVPYMQTIQVNKLKFNNLTDEQVLERYDRISSIIESKIQKAKSEGKPTDRYVQYQKQVDDILPQTGIQINCDLVKNNLEPKFRQNPNDAALAKKIFFYMLQGKCTDDPLWLETGEVLIKEEPDYAIVKNLAIKYLQQENYAKAGEFLDKALTLASTGSDKADILILQGSLSAKRGAKSTARDKYRQALAADPGRKEAYEKIGDLYMTSGDDCAKKQSLAEDRLVYLAAYEMYARAGDQKKMANAKEQFPSVPEMFELNWKEGETKRVECWINEDVVLKARAK